MYVYMYESLATTFREYKTIRMSEFYGMTNILLYPQPPKALVPAKNMMIQSEDDERVRVM